MSENVLPVYTVYYNASDYPGEYVVRRWTVRPDAQLVPDAPLFCRADTLDRVRAELPEGLVRLARSPTDEACIVETWI